jgi:hypothetical protein
VQIVIMLLLHGIHGNVSIDGTHHRAQYYWLHDHCQSLMTYSITMVKHPDEATMAHLDAVKTRALLGIEVMNVTQHEQGTWSFLPLLRPRCPPSSNNHTFAPK